MGEVDISSGQPERFTRAKDLRWYRRWLRYQWRRITRKEQKVHSRLVRRFPVAFPAMESCLEVVYGFITSPGFAVVLTFLLVGLVISEVVTLIVSLSVFSAWMVSVISVARNDSIKRLPILRRVVLVIMFAIGSGFLSNWYVKWTLTNYSNHHPALEASAHENPDSLLVGVLMDKLAKLNKDSATRTEPLPVSVPVYPLQNVTNDRLNEITLFEIKELSEPINQWSGYEFRIKMNLAERSQRGQIKGSPAFRDMTPEELAPYAKEAEKNGLRIGREMRIRMEDIVVRICDLRYEILRNRIHSWEIDDLPSSTQLDPVFAKVKSGNYELKGVQVIRDYMVALQKKLDFSVKHN